MPDHTPTPNHRTVLPFPADELVSGRHLLGLVEGYNCTAAAIFEFPSDGFTRQQRQHGWVVLHFVLACYGFVLLAIVCDDYFVPTIKRICDGKIGRCLVVEVDVQGRYL